MPKDNHRHRKLVFIPTRKGELSQTLRSLIDWFENIAGWKVHLLQGKPSIFEAIKGARDEFSFHPTDSIILCHDDIEILYSSSHFNNLVDTALSVPETGFAGFAGTPVLNPDACWWRSSSYGKMSGFCFHGEDLMNPTYFGPPQDVVVLDGVFLAAKGNVWNTIQLKKPQSFIGDWDFYDIFLTFQAHVKGFRNRGLPITFRHDSPGVPRPTWDMNRRAFTELFREHLPART